MKKAFIVISLLLTVGISVLAFGQETLKLFYVYSEKDAENSHFFVPSGWLGDYADLTLDEGWTDNCWDGSTCIKITYNNRASMGQRWAGIYWQNPANNWGAEPNAGVNLTGIKQLTFWARGDKGGEIIKAFLVGGIKGPFPDSAAVAIGPAILTSDWRQYTIPLKGKNLSHIIGGFGWTTSLDVNPEGCTFYLDEIRYE